MAHVSSIGASLFSDLSVGFAATTLQIADTKLPSTPTVITNWATDLFNVDDSLSGNVPGTIAAGEFVRIENIREFPAIGTPPNIVNVPVYGQKTSQQVQGQADAPSMEITINYIPSVWAKGTVLGNLVGDGLIHAFRFSLLNSKPNGYSSTPSATLGLGGATAAPTGNSQYFWLGKIEALLVNPQLTDATTATLTISVQSDMYGAFTTANA